jgi:hypothetical protein
MESGGFDESAFMHIRHSRFQMLCGGDSRDARSDRGIARRIVLCATRFTHDGRKRAQRVRGIMPGNLKFYD